MNAPSPTVSSPPAVARWQRFIVSLLWWLVLSWSLSFLGNRSLILTLAVVLGLATLAVVIGLAWISRWALDDRARLTQLTLGTAMLVTLFVAGWLGAVRWLFFTNTPPGALPDTPQEAIFERIEIAMFVTLIGSFLSIIPIFWFADGLVWLAVSVVRRPIIRRLLRRMRKQSKAAN